MSRRYDSRTTVFSPEGRLFQVEYALESISNAGIVIGILAEAGDPKADDSETKIESPDDAAPTAETIEKGKKMDIDMETEHAVRSRIKKQVKEKEEAERKAKYPGPAKPGIVLVAEKKMVSKLLETESGTREKIYMLNDDILVSAAGITADANSLVNYARNAAQSHLSQYNENIPVEQIVRRVCDHKQSYTQLGGLRPFGVSFLYGGYDAHHKFQLYSSDPSGNYAGWKAHCLGNNSGTATTMLRQEWRPDMGIDEALGVSLKVLARTMDSVAMNSERVEIAALTLDSNGKPVMTIFSPAEVDRLLEKEGHKKSDDDAK